MLTTDNQNELFDLVNENDVVIGQATRQEVHANKQMIHRSIGIFVFNLKGELLLQLRSATKDTDPLKWTISCSGHVNAGDTYDMTVKRELQEELGIQAPCTYIMKYMCKAPRETEINALFKAQSEGPFKYHPQEIATGKFFTQKELKKAIQKEEIVLSFMGKIALQKIGWV
jgi:16S rRNA (adenine1518-N6/adenine1519-N6)-dimethyltransferase